MWRFALLGCFIASGNLQAQAMRQEPKPAPPQEAPRRPRRPPVVVVVEERPEHEQAESVAMSETGGRAVWSRKVDLNGATGGWEVGIHMKGQQEGWKVLVDRDTWKMRSKTRIPNP